MSRSFTGDLRERPLARLLIELWQARYTGALVLHSGRTEKRVLLREGEPVLAESNLPSDSLARHLVRQQALPAEAEARVAEFARARSCREEAALLGLKLIGPRELVLALREVVRRRILGCFAWPAGEFRLDPDTAPPAESAHLRAEPLALIRDGVATHWPPDRVLAELGAALTRYPRRTAGFESAAWRLADDPDAKTLLEALDERSLSGSALPRSGAPAALAALWVLVAGGALEFADEPASEAPPAAEPARALGPEIEILIADAALGSDADVRPDASVRASSSADDARIDALREELRAKHARLAEVDLYQILGVDRSASPVDVKRAYLQAAKRFHPDALARLGLDDVKTEANEVFAQIARAHEVLFDAGRRADYDASLSGETELDASRLAQAETLYRKGEILLRAGNFAGALEFLEASVSLWPEEAAYCSALGWALFKKNPPDLPRAREHLEHAVQLDPRDPGARQRLEMVRQELARKR